MSDLNAVRNGDIITAKDTESTRPTRRTRHVPHGTDSGYYKHRRGGFGNQTTPCDACRAAHAARERERTGRKPRVHKPRPEPIVRIIGPVRSTSSSRPPEDAALTWVPVGGIKVALWSVRRG